MDEKLLSILITAFNEEKYLNRCVDSIINALGDSFNKVEIIISNNNSTDKTLEIAEEYCKQYSNIFVYTSTKQGPSVARNFGIQYSNCKYITFIDGDDYVDGNLLEVLNTLEKYEDVDIFQLTCHIHKNGETLIPKLCEDEQYNKKISQQEFLDNLKLDAGFSSSSGRIINKNLIVSNNLQYDERFMQMEDMEFGVRLWVRAKTFVFLDKPYYHYETRHENSLTNKISLKRMLQGVGASATAISYLLSREDCKRYKKLFQFVSLLSYSLIRRYKELTKEEKQIFLKELKKNKIILNYPYYFSTKLFYIVYKVFGLKVALKFV